MTRIESLEHHLKKHPVTMAFYGLSKARLEEELCKAKAQVLERKSKNQKQMAMSRAGAAAKRNAKAEEKKLPK